MNIFPRPRLFSVSPWLLAAATGLLVLIVVTFTLNNIRREEQLMTAAMLQKADTLTKIIHSGAKSAYFYDLQRGVWNPEPWQAYIQRVIDHVVEDPDVKFLAVVDEASTVVVHSDSERIGQVMEFVLPKQLPQSLDSNNPIGFRITTFEDSGRVFEAVRPFLPYRSFPKRLGSDRLKKRYSRNTLTPRGLMFRRLWQNPSAEEFDDRSYYVLVGLDMSSYDQSLRRIKLQTFFLSLVMLLVGLGGWLSLAAVQGYRVSQRTLDEMKLFTNLLLSKLPVGIIAIDNMGKITTINESAEEMVGVKKEFARGKTVEAVLPSELAKLFASPEDQKTFTASINGGEKEVTLNIQGKVCHYLCHVIDIESEQAEQKGRVLLVSDLTLLKGLEREMRENERLAAVGRMAAGVAHEVRNPLSSIKGLALLLKKKLPDNSSDSEAADLLVEQVERMNRTVSELLSFARPAPLNLQNVSVNDLLSDTLRLIETDASSAGIDTRLEASSDLLDVAADRDRLSQVFINLFLNSVQAMEKGGELLVTAVNGVGEKTVVIKVHDNGCGIPQENLQQLFYPYFTTKTGGSGIGLAISQKIISDHKGVIRVESVEGKGTTVTVELPVSGEVTGA